MQASAFFYYTHHVGVEEVAQYVHYYSVTQPRNRLLINMRNEYSKHPYMRSKYRTNGNTWLWLLHLRYTVVVVAKQ